MVPPKYAYYLGVNPERDLLLKILRTSLFLLREWARRHNNATIFGFNILPIVIFLGHLNSLISHAIDEGHQMAGQERVRRLTVQLTAEEERLGSMSQDAPTQDSTLPPNQTETQETSDVATPPPTPAAADSVTPSSNVIAVAVVPPQPQPPTDLVHGSRQDVPPRFQNRRGAFQGQRGRGGSRVRGHRNHRRP